MGANRDCLSAVNNLIKKLNFGKKTLLSATAHKITNHEKAIFFVSIKLAR